MLWKLIVKISLNLIEQVFLHKTWGKFFSNIDYFFHQQFQSHICHLKQAIFFSKLVSSRKRGFGITFFFLFIFIQLNFFLYVSTGKFFVTITLIHSIKKVVYVEKSCYLHS